jgi:hypothetical protein
MEWFKSPIGVLSRALGPRRYSVIGIINSIGIIYSLLRRWPEMTWLPDIPGFWIGIAITILLLTWWLVERAQQLEQEIEPRLSIEFEPKQPYVITDPLYGTGAVVRMIRVRVTNKSAKKIEGCLLRLERIRDKDDNDGFFIPVAMITQHQHLQQRKGGRFNLDGKSYKFVNIAMLNESSAGEPIALMYETVTAEKPYPNAVPRENGPYILDLAAYGGTGPVTKQFKLSVSPQGQLNMHEIS